MKALVTGACGFVGRYLIRHLVEQGDTVMGGYLADNFPRNSQASYQRLDVRNFEECSKVIGGYHPDVIYHLAGIAFVPEAEKNFDDTLGSNVTGVHNVLRIPYLLERKTRVVIVSSAEVYGKIEPHELPLTENQPLRPANNYSLSKVFGEMVSQKFERAGYIDPIIIRPFNHIGPEQNVRFVASNFACQLARIAKGYAPPVLRVGNLNAERDFSDVRDIVRGYRLAALKGKGIYNFSSGKAISIQSLLDTLIEISGLKIKIEEDPERMRPAEMPRVFGDYSKAKRELGWEPTIPLRESLEGIYNYWFKIAEPD